MRLLAGGVLAGRLAGSRAAWRCAAGTITLLVWLALLAGCSGPREAALPAQSTVLVLGDSISAGFGLPREQSWVALLGPLTGWQVVNGGVSGDTTLQARERLPELLETHRPAAVIIELGGNDMLRRRPGGEIAQSLEALIADVRAAGAKPVLMAIPEPSLAGAAFGSLSDADLYAEVAKRSKVPLIDEAVASVLSSSALKLDHLHPNADGHRELAGKVRDKLRKLGLLAGR